MEDLDHFIENELEMYSIEKFLKLPVCPTCEKGELKIVYEEYIKKFLKSSELLTLFKLMEYIQENLKCNLELCDYDDEMKFALLYLKKGNFRDISILLKPLKHLQEEEITLMPNQEEH